MALPKFQDYCYLDDETKISLSLVEFFNEYEVICISSNLDPKHTASSLEDYSVYSYPLEQLREDVRKNKLSRSRVDIECLDYYGNNEQEIFKIHSKDAKKWATYHGYKWDIPEYREFNSSEITSEQGDDQLQQANERIAELEQQLADIQSTTTKQSAVDNVEYNGDLPLSTNEEKLAHFINLLIKASPELQKDGRIPTYSELHTILTAKNKGEQIPSKVTIQKYMNRV
ncbi:hypothetical protein [Lonepinella sp. MS14436]|uniref:hypothetical protein n=1 Tax=Lonepinella sp. MS14436 TaxID=3003619 RepID=UPI0036DC5C9C